MVNPGAFQGKRKDFLFAEKAAYAAAVEGDYAADAIANIQRRFFKRFPVELPVDQEPTQDFLDAVNDDEADKEPDLPVLSELTPEEYEKAMKTLEQRRDLIAFRKGQIKRWLVYQHMKDNNVDDPSKEGAYRALLQKLTGVGDSRPRQKTASNVWRRDLRDVIEAEARRRVQSLDKKKLAAIRQTVASEMFAALSKEEKEKWDKLAKTEHTFAVDKWEAEINGPPSTRPADRQRCIMGLVSFIQPILDGMTAATGWKCSLIAGGPEPASGGRLTIVSAHSGTTTGDIKMNFVRAERQKYKDGVLPAFGSFLRKCYTPEDCRAFALSPNSNIHGMDAAEFEKEGSSVDPLPDPETVGFTATSTPGAPPILPRMQSPAPAVAPPAPSATSSTAAATQAPCATAPTATPTAACSTSTSCTPTATTSHQPEQPRITSTIPGTTLAVASTVSPTDTPSPPIQPQCTAPSVASVVPTPNSTPVPSGELQHMDVDLPSNNSEPPLLLVLDSANSHSPPRLHPPCPEETILSPPPPAGVPPPPKHPTPTELPTSASPPISPPLSPVRAASPPLLSSASPPVSPPLSPTRANSPPLPNDTLPEMPPPPSPPHAKPPPLPDDTHLETSHHFDNAPQHALMHPPPSAHVMSILSALSLYPLNALPAISTTSSLSGLIRPPYTNSHRSSSPSAASTASSASSSSTKSSSSNSSSSSPATSVTSMSDSEDEGPHTFGHEADASARRTRSQASKSASVLKPRGATKRQKGVRAVKDDALAARRSKRQRVDGATTPAPDWFTKAWTGFASEDLGAKWTSFLELWRDFEGREGFKDGAKLGSRNRPAIIEEWIAHRHRSTSWRPAIDIKDFECGFKAWWISLQPDWRVSRGTVKKSQLDGDWGTLKRSGKNGLLSVVAALFFWGVNAQGNAKSRKPWLTALDDCSSVLACL